ncbi:hypothetical protein MKQ70_19015 [Chitinophaga sedimenti]|uniref:galactokinase n=1 Tax=Chitinophaga sedimenti TaxID=2033606 RepID=UPI0020061150|nr:hypothetical protein [Chitinophaga sedimenti]MCK7556991.1 hypothetical protein [Chitinophaga sedimenti]
MLLDCRSLEYQYFPFKFSDTYNIVLCNSMVHHSLATSEYNVRREQCEKGVEILKAFIPGINSLRDVTAAQVEQYKEHLPGKIYDRCLYVTQENERVVKATKLLQDGDLEGLGKLMYGSHDGLSKLYEVSCPELDFLVDCVRNNPDVAGARMMGGGFGGCTINLVKSAKVDAFVASMKKLYSEKFDEVMEVYVTSIEAGVTVFQEEPVH